MKACPFCGSGTAPMITTDAEIEGDTFDGDGGISHVVVCDATNHGCGAAGGYRGMPDEAIAAWDMRMEK